MANIIDPTNRTSEASTLLGDNRKRMQALFSAAAGYLGLSPQELRAQQQGGKSLADIATDQGKSTDGLRRAMIEADPGTSAPSGINPMMVIDRMINARPETHGHRGHHGGHGGHTGGQQPGAVDPVQQDQGQDAAFPGGASKPTI